MIAPPLAISIIFCLEDKLLDSGETLEPAIETFFGERCGE